MTACARSISAPPALTPVYPGQRGSSPIVFCDFDGTITQADTLQAVCERFAPAATRDVLAAIATGACSLRAGVPRLIGSLRTEDAADIRRFVCRLPLRAGFGSFLLRMRERKVPVVVLSSGMDFCVAARLAPWQALIQSIHALPVAFGDPYLRACPSLADPAEALPKTAFMQRYPGHPKILIGDSFSDQRAALQADCVFARGRLLHYLRRRRVSAVPYRNFHDILRRFPVPPGGGAGKGSRRRKPPAPR